MRSRCTVAHFTPVCVSTVSQPFFASNATICTGGMQPGVYVGGWNRPMSTTPLATAWLSPSTTPMGPMSCWRQLVSTVAFVASLQSVLMRYMVSPAWAGPMAALKPPALNLPIPTPLPRLAQVSTIASLRTPHLRSSTKAEHTCTADSNMPLVHWTSKHHLGTSTARVTIARCFQSCRGKLMQQVSSSTCAIMCAFFSFNCFAANEKGRWG